ncbi:unnamed protein product [Clonostachys rosea f. rosea IK726]|uniref:Uncharacterized protein n=1 Tax=Clonostachys rosea f. rosea IK726 TaxID=1349383 RepID=A0ACA9U7Q4_BIOOC|nr:unnamed protein product [Clonostachys rosea f. rosea IK726]
MPSATGQDWEKYQKKFADDEVEEKKITPLTDEYAPTVLQLSSRANAHMSKQGYPSPQTYGAAPYGAALKKLEKQIKEKQQSVDERSQGTTAPPPHQDLIQASD